MGTSGCRGARNLTGVRVVAANTAGRRSGRQPGVVVLAEQMPVVRVLLGDADPLAAQAITSLLDAAAEVSVIGCESAPLGLTHAVEELSPSVLVVDVGQRQFRGMELLAQWIAGCGRVVVLSTDLNPTDVVELLRAGVRGVIDKADASLLVMAVRAAAAGQVFVAPTVGTPMVDRWRAADTPTLEPPPIATMPMPPEMVAPGGRLTRQERAVLVLMAAGHSSDEVARQLGVAAGTLQGHMHRVIGKLKVRDRTQAVAWAYLSGLATVPTHPLVP